MQQASTYNSNTTTQFDSRNKRQIGRSITSSTSNNASLSATMELIDSIKKQRELFSQTLTTAQMPNKLAVNASTAVENSTRKPLSPRNKKGGNETRELVSCLRNKRDEHISRFEQPNLPSLRNTASSNTKDDKHAYNQENQSYRNSFKKKPVVDLSFLDQEKAPSGATFTKITKPSELPKYRRRSQSDAFAGDCYREEIAGAPEVLAQAKHHLRKTAAVAPQPSTPEKQSSGIISEKSLTAVNTSTKAAVASQNKEPEGIKASFSPPDTRLKVAVPKIPDTGKVHPISPRKMSTTTEARKAKGNPKPNAAWMKTENRNDKNLDAEKSPLKAADTSWIKKTNSSNNADQSEQQAPKPEIVDSAWIRKGNNALDSTGEFDTNNKQFFVHRKEIKAVLQDNPMASPPRDLVGAEGIVGGRKALFEPTMSKKENSKEKKVDIKAARKSLLVTRKQPKEVHNRRKSAPINVAWMKKEERAPHFERTLSPQKRKDISNECDVEDRKKVSEPSSWIKQKTEGTYAEKNQQTTSNVRPVKDTPWIKHEAQTTRANKDAMLQQISAPGVYRGAANASPNIFLYRTSKQPPIHSSILDERKDHTDADSEKAKALSAQNEQKRGFVCPKGVAPPEWLRSPKLVHAKADSTNNDDGQSSDTDVEDQQEPQQLNLGAKVNMFDNHGHDNNTKRSRFFWEISEVSSQPRGRPTNPNIAGSAMISSLMETMEKISLGQGAAIIDEPSNDFEQRDDLVEKSADSAFLDQYSDVEAFEYGDANFSFTDVYQGCEETSENGYLVDCDDVSEGSTYKVDNYHKDFNSSIHIQSPWQHHEEPPESIIAYDESCGPYDELCAPEMTTTMKIVSIAPSESYYEEPNGASPNHNQVCSIPRDSIDEIPFQKESKNLFICRSHNHVSRHSILSTSDNQRKEASDERGRQREDVDPIFQVSDYDPKSKTARGFINFLSKPAAAEQEEPKSTKGVFRILKKGLGSASASKEGSVVEDTAEEVSEEASNARTTLSSITRSVYSNPGESVRSGDGKPLGGVLNGFFKAARKYQKKRKAKADNRGRSMSNKPPVGRTPAGSIPPKTAVQPPAEVQLWPAKDNFEAAVPDSMPPPMLSPNIDRRFGAYGGLASVRSKALDTSSVCLQSLASW